MASIPVDVTLVDGTATTTTLVTLDPAEWTPDDARPFVWDVWRLLLASGEPSVRGHRRRRTHRHHPTPAMV